MVTLTPSRLPQVRDDITRFCSSQVLAMLLTTHRDQRGHHELPLPEASMAWHNALEAYQRRLVDLAEAATLYFVPTATTAAITTAPRGEPQHRLQPEDLPAERGLILFEAPIGRTPPDIALRLPPASVVGVLWGPALHADGRPGVVAVLWADTSELAEHDERAGQRHQAAKRREVAGLVTYHDEVVLPFGDIRANLSRPNEDAARRDALATLVRTWSLMHQPNASCALDPLPRQLRRRYERRGQPPPEVRVITLAEPPHEQTLNRAGIQQH